MGRYNNGTVTTNSNCVSCNRCISVCPITGSNVSTSRNGVNSVEVSNKCIACGACVKACTHDARECRDDSRSFFSDLQNGEKISVLIDPAFYYIYKEKSEKIFGYLKSLGVNKIYDVAFGADISIWAHVRYLKEHNAQEGKCKEFIANSCAAAISYVQNAMPDMVPFMIPVQSPAFCTAIYVRKYLGDNSRLCYINPCVASVDEIKSVKTGLNIRYSVIFSQLDKILADADIENCFAQTDLETLGPGNYIPFMTKFKDTVALCFPRTAAIVHYSGISGSSVKSFKEAASRTGSGRPIFASASICRDGCLSGSGISHQTLSPASLFFGYKKGDPVQAALIEENLSSKEYYEMVCDHFKDLNISDFYREYEDKYTQPYLVPESTVNEIFKSMHKDTETKRTINCRACGYRTCKDMAVAIANGYARMQDCPHFMNDELAHKAFEDQQTGLPNGRAFDFEAPKLIRSNPYSKYVVLIININKLRSINELYGHDVGNHVLEFVARWVKETATKYNGLCARRGGSIFAICAEYGKELMDEIDVLEQFDCRHLGVDYPVTARIGAYVVDDAKSVGDDINEICNLATYAGDKIRNTSRVTLNFFNAQMHEELVAENTITREMKNAMANNEFVLYLQPQYNTATGELVGAEALSRWVKEDGTIISPGLFVPIFEKNGYVKTLDVNMWEQAYRLIRKWEDAGENIVPISVNISRVSLEDDSLIEVFKAFQNKYKINKDHLHLEITESAYMEDQELLSQRIRKLRNLGYMIAMDDFGSGYSSLISLKEIPIDILKLDMGFLRGNSYSEKGGNIISNVVRMAHSIGMLTVAEGVETREQVEFLQSIGCSVIQGFYYERPMPTDKYYALLKNSALSQAIMPLPEEKKINLNHFFDDNFGETLMFDNFTGPAALFEYDNTGAALLKINSDALSMIGYANATEFDFSRDILGRCDVTVKKRLQSEMNEKIREQKEFTKLLHYPHPDGGYLWIKARVWNIGNNGNKAILYAIGEDITEDVEKIASHEKDSL